MQNIRILRPHLSLQVPADGLKRHHLIFRRLQVMVEALLRPKDAAAAAAAVAVRAESPRDNDLSAAFRLLELVVGLFELSAQRPDLYVCEERRQVRVASNTVASWFVLVLLFGHTRGR